MNPCIRPVRVQISSDDVNHPLTWTARPCVSQWTRGRAGRRSVFAMDRDAGDVSPSVNRSPAGGHDSDRSAPGETARDKWFSSLNTELVLCGMRQALQADPGPYTWVFCLARCDAQLVGPFGSDGHGHTSFGSPSAHVGHGCSVSVFNKCRWWPLDPPPPCQLNR